MTLETTYADAFGGAGYQYRCSACGYFADHDVSYCDEDAQPQWTANKIDGISVCGYGGGACAKRLPGSLVATRHRYVTSQFRWVLFVTATEVVVVKGSLDDTVLNRLVASARDFLSSITLHVEMTAADIEALFLSMPQRDPVVEDTDEIPFI